MGDRESWGEAFENPETGETGYAKDVQDRLMPTTRGLSTKPMRVRAKGEGPTVAPKLQKYKDGLDISKGSEVVYHGTPSKIEGGKLKRGSSGAIFFTPSKDYAEIYKGSSKEGNIHEFVLTKEKKDSLFDLKNKEHIERLKEGFLNNNEDLEIEYDSKEDALNDYNRFVKKMQESSRKLTTSSLR